MAWVETGVDKFWWMMIHSTCWMLIDWQCRWFSDTLHEPYSIDSQPQHTYTHTHTRTHNYYWFIEGWGYRTVVYFICRLPVTFPCKYNKSIERFLERFSTYYLFRYSWAWADIVWFRIVGKFIILWNSYTLYAWFTFRTKSHQPFSQNVDCCQCLRAAQK